MMKTTGKWIAIISMAVLAVVILASGLMVALGVGGGSGNLLHRGQIESMAQYLNDKYGYELSADDCTYFREEDYSYHKGFPSGVTYDVPYIAIFQYAGKYITVTDRNGYMGDDAQLEELNGLLCGYYEELTGLEIAFLEVREMTNGNTKDETLNRLLHHAFHDKLTAENIGQFVDCIFGDSAQELEFIFYFAAEQDMAAQIEQITSRLALVKRDEKVSSVRFYISDMEKLNIHYFQPKVHRQTADENGRESDEGYVWGHYHVVNSVEHHYPRSESSYYQDVQHNTFVAGGYRSSSANGGFANREIVQVNGFGVVDLSDQKLSEYLVNMHSYGTYGDLTILVRIGDTAMVAETTIGRERYQWTFRWGSGPVELYAFQHGRLMDLQTAYDCGYLSVVDMDQILEVHKAYFAQHHDWQYDEVQ